MMERLRWLGIFEDRKIGVAGLTPAKVLQKLLEEKWALEPKDKDMIVMQHQFDYKEKSSGKRKKIYATMTYIGEDQQHTAMAATVGLPVAIVAKMILQGVINLKGVQLPIIKEVYDPVLEELKEFGIHFTEEEIEIEGPKESA